MKLEIIKDGSIQGWFISFLITMVSICSFILSLIFDSICDRFAKVGSTWATIAIAQFTAWLAYRAYTAKTESLERKDVRDAPPY
jgi:hypothetical protein